MEYRELAIAAGVKNFRRVPALDTDPAFIAALTDLVEQAMAETATNLDQAAQLPSKLNPSPQRKWTWGWSNDSELWNGRVAMLGTAAILMEVISRHGPLHGLGLL
jgi:ferrochelatase